MSDADNPYRFVEAVEYEESADAPSPAVDSRIADWDLRAYVAPTEEPIYSPQEIAELGRNWSGFALTTFLHLMVAMVATFLLLFLFFAGYADGAALFLFAYAMVGVATISLVLWHEASLLLIRLGYGRFRARSSALLYIVPFSNLSLLFPLYRETSGVLRRHGIPAGLWRVPGESLPRPISDRPERSP